MKTLKLLVLATLALLLADCKSPTQVMLPATPSLLEVHHVLDTTQSILLAIADETNADPMRSVVYTAAWLSTQPGVRSATALDSTTIEIVMNSGVATTFGIQLVDQNGVCVSRGGAIRNAPATDTTAAREPGLEVLANNSIDNDSILIFAAAYTEFGLSEQHIRSLIGTSKLGLNVTILKDDQCTYGMVQHFGDYGLVIYDGHGFPDACLLGTRLSMQAPPLDEAALKDSIVRQGGLDMYNKLISGDLRLVSEVQLTSLQPGWQKLIAKNHSLRITATSQYIRSLPQMPRTLLLGNMCYSGWTAPTVMVPPVDVPGGMIAGPAHTIPGYTKTYDPIATAFTSRNLISYYGYAFADGKSEKVSNPFAQSMEDTLLTELAIEVDSTGIAHLRSDASTRFVDAGGWATSLIHFGHDDYSYNNCGEPFTNPRDGQTYPTVYIDKQVWMAQNLNYAAPGSRCYADTADYCSTYGRLYDWSTMMHGAAASNANPSGVQGVCPKGWHVPSLAEWNQMITFLGGADIAGGALRSTSTLWESSYSGFPGVPGTNSSGFSALPAGYGDLPSSSWAGIRGQAVIGTASSDPSGSVVQYYWMELDWNSLAVTTQHETSTIGNSCRCVKDH